MAEELVHLVRDSDISLWIWDPILPSQTTTDTYGFSGGEYHLQNIMAMIRTLD